ncbi:MAG TPA: 2OG-Fe(II) oxygenase [Bryobacteraceae bacterium]|nr:2OG-Fe(II) oxygenase [Bryobacteraceae bacterium]
MRSPTIRDRLDALDWKTLEADLWLSGAAKSPPILTTAECADAVALHGRPERFRSHIDMARFRFGVGDYHYFADPLPALVRELREHAYPHLAPIANGWMEALGMAERFPAHLKTFLETCHRAGQTKPTPLLLHYQAGGYNCLHQDLYGAVAFPLQMVCFLSEPGRDYQGGEFLLVEQRPRAQSIGRAIAGRQGEILIFTTRHKPVQGARGFYRAAVKHGVSPLVSGTRYTLGIIFHDAQ